MQVKTKVQKSVCLGWQKTYNQCCIAGIDKNEMYREFLFGDLKKREQFKDNNMKVGLEETAFEVLD